MIKHILAAGAGAAALWIGPAHAQDMQEVYLAQFLNASLANEPAVSVPEAWATPYARLQLSEFVKAVRQDADAACLRSKKVDDAAIAGRGRDFLVRHGTGLAQKILANVDRQAYRAALAAKAGANAEDELAMLRANPIVQEYMRIERAGYLSWLLDFIMEQFERYTVLERIKLKRTSMMSTGNAVLMEASPGSTMVEKLDEFADKHKSAEVDRYRVLDEAGLAAMDEAFDKAKAREWGPRMFFSGVETDLAAICMVYEAGR